MKVCVFGATGQIGTEFLRQLKSISRIKAVAIGRNDVDISAHPDGVRGRLNQFFSRERPDVVINAAAYTAVDRAEQDIEAAFQLNAWFPGELARLTKASGASLIHFSTDYVFGSGSGDRPHRETDACIPLNVYGQSKLEGEQAVLQAHDRAVIIRTSWVVGIDGQNFAKTILRLSCQRSHLNVVSDQFGVPSSARFLVETLLSADLGSFGKNVCGVYHLCPAGETTWHAYACWILESAIQHPHWRERIRIESVESIRPISSREYLTLAKRPTNSRLDCSRWIESVRAMNFPSWQDATRTTLDEILDTEQIIRSKN